MPKTQMSLRLSVATRAQLHTLQAAWETTQTEVVTLSIERQYQALPALTRKVAENIDAGLWASYGIHYIARVDYYSPEPDEDGTILPDQYTISHHEGERPGFALNAFDTIADLITAMQQLEPNARKWHVCTE